MILVIINLSLYKGIPMRILSLLVKNFELAAHLDDMAARSNHIPTNEQSDATVEEWTTRINSDWMVSLENIINTITPQQKKRLSITPQDILSMQSRIQEFYQSQRVLKVALIDLYNDYPHLSTRYCHMFEEGLTNLVSDIETIYINASVEIKKKKYMISSMLRLDNQEAKNYINRFEGYHEQSLASMRMIEDHYFTFYVDINLQTAAGLVPLASFNKFTTHNAKYNSLVKEIQAALEEDYRVLTNFSDNNIALQHFTQKQEMIPGILENCQSDSLLHDATEESLVAFKDWIEQQAVEIQLERDLEKSDIHSQLLAIRDKQGEYN